MIIAAAVLERSPSALRDGGFVDAMIGALEAEPEDELLVDPLMLQVLVDPVVLSSGHVVERASACDAASGRLHFRLCPFTREPLRARVYPLVALRARAREWRVARLAEAERVAAKLLDEGLEADARRVVAIAEPLLVGLAGTADFAPRAAALAETRRRAGVRLLAWPSNDEGATVALGNDRSFPGYRGSDKFYCGRRMAIPGSDGQCGPSAGPQCASCEHFQLRYPAAAEETWCAAEAKANDTEENRMELWQHAWNGRIEAVRRYIAMGVDVNWKNTHSFGYTALIMAVQKGHLEVVKLLLASGAHINLADDETGATPLNWGAYQAHVDIVRFLLESGAEKNIACVKESWAGFKPIDVACFQDPNHANYGAITALLR